MAYVILGGDCRHIYGYTTTLKQAEEAVRKLSYIDTDDFFYEELPKLDNLEIPDKLYVTVSETSASTTPKIRKVSYLNEKKPNTIHENFKKACRDEEFAKTKLFMYQHFVIETKEGESEEELNKRILERYNELFEKNLKTHPKGITDYRR